jgi:hypothetical protein
MEKHTHEYFSEMLKRTGAVTMVNGEWVPMTPENCPKIRIYNPKQTMTQLHRMLATFHPVGSWAQIHFPAPSPQADSKSQLKSPVTIIDDMRGTSQENSISRAKSLKILTFETGNKTHCLIASGGKMFDYDIAARLLEEAT